MSSSSDSEDGIRPFVFKEFNIDSMSLTDAVHRHLGNFDDDYEQYEDARDDETGKPPPQMEPTSLRLKHREKLKSSQKDGKVPYELSSSSDRAHVSTSPLVPLQPTIISNLRINIPAKGYYLLLRVIESPIVSDCISTIVEDSTGDVFNFSSYNSFDPDSERFPEYIIPPGTTFVLKEPLLKSSYNSEYTIRCDSPTDMLIIAKHQKLYDLVRDVSWKHQIIEPQDDPTSLEEWKILGNERFKASMFSQAIEAYFMALKFAEEDDLESNIALYSNISAAYLKLDCFEAVLKFTEYVLNRDPSNVKASYRAGRAHYELRQYREAKEKFENVLKAEPSNNEAERELSRCKLRFQEQSGNIDINRLFQLRLTEPKTEIDCADYVGPLKIVPIANKGRGVVATDDIKTGTLLCVSKAIRAAFDEPDNSPHSDENLMNEHGENVKLVSKIAVAIMKNPNTIGKQIYDLACNDPTVETKLFSDEETQKEPIADIERIKGILNTNCHGISAPTCMRDPLASSQTMNDGSGLFLLSSYINHSCLFNASWETFNDVMVVFAVRPISNGEEVTVAYVNNMEPYSERRKCCKRRNFECSCRLCDLDRSDSPEARKRKSLILQKFKIMTQGIENKCQPVSKRELKEMNEIVQDVERIYKQCNRSELKPDLCIPYVKLALGMLQRGELDEMTKQLEKAMNCVGLTSSELLHFSEHNEPLPSKCLVNPDWFFIAQVATLGHSLFGKPLDSVTWLKVLISLEKVYIGGNAQTVLAKYTNIPGYLFDLV